MDDEAKAMLAEAKGLAERLSLCLPTLVPAAGLSHRSKLPFKATSIRELLIHRMSNLATSAIRSIEAGDVVPGSVLTRASVETVAVLFCLNQAVEQFLELRDVERIDSFLMSSLVGARWSGHPVQSINVLTLIDKVTKTIPAFRASYDNLSEYAHPNWSGLLGSYGLIDKENYELHLGKADNSAGLKAALSVLSGALLTFEHYYNLSADNLGEFNRYFDGHGADGGA
jgi:hypothetical protein